MPMRTRRRDAWARQSSNGKNVALVLDRDRHRPETLLRVGQAVLDDHRLIVVAAEGAPLSAKLSQVADIIEYYDAADLTSIIDATTRAMRRA